MKKWRSLCLQYTEPKEILRELDVGKGVRILVVGDGSNGAYEWVIERELHVERHSDCGYGIADVALRDGLIAFYPLSAGEHALRTIPDLGEDHFTRPG